MYQPRLYREEMNRERFRFFQCSHFETDLLIGIPPGQYLHTMKNRALQEVRRIRGEVERFISVHPHFAASLVPIHFSDLLAAGIRMEDIPPEITGMLRSAIHSGTGPMSAVAGLFAEKTGTHLSALYGLSEIVVENGGDLFMQAGSDATVVIRAGESPLSGKVALHIPPGTWGICTSSGTVGHSFSFGKADAVTVVAASVPLADAWATSLANRVGDPGDIEKVLDLAQEIPEILGCVVVIRERMGIRGQFELKPLN